MLSEINMQNFDHVAFQVCHMEEAIRFYVEKLGFTLASSAVNAEEHEAYSFLTMGNLRLELIQDLKQAHFTRPSIQPPYCPHLAIETGDMRQAVASLKENGVEIIHGPLQVPGEETWVYFKDPDNNVLEYIQWCKER
jgi:lactoylglutathione lyase